MNFKKITASMLVSIMALSMVASATDATEVTEDTVPMTELTEATTTEVTEEVVTEETVEEQLDAVVTEGEEAEEALDVMPVVTPEVMEALATDSKVLVNGTEVLFDAYNIGGNNYFKLRDIAKVLSGSASQFEVSFDKATNSISITTEMAYTEVGGELALGDGTTKTANLSTSKVLVNGEEKTLTAYNIADNNFFKLRDLGDVLGFVVDWDAENNTVIINDATEATEEVEVVDATELTEATETPEVVDAIPLEDATTTEETEVE